MKLFDTVPKKLAISAFVLFAVGWIVFIVGFGLLLNELVTESDTVTLLNSLYVPYYFTLAGGPFVIAFGLIHAALPSNLAGAIIGAISTILNNIYFVLVGFVVSYGHFLIQRQLIVTNFNLMFAGAILLAVSWSFSQILLVFFNKSSQTQRKNLWVLIKDIFTGNHEGQHQVTRTSTAAIRLLSIPAVAFSFIGWGVYLGGMHNILQALTTGGNTNFIALFNHFPSWGSVTITPFGFLVALLQAVTSGSETVLGSLLSILNSFIIVCVGYVVTIIGIIFVVQGDLGSDPLDNQYIYNLIFGGGIVFLFFWTAMLTLSRFYDAVHSIWATDNTSNQLQASRSAPSGSVQHNASAFNNSAISQSEFQMTAAAEPPPAYDYKQP